jgi:hypothetical protein
VKTCIIQAPGFGSSAVERRRSPKLSEGPAPDLSLRHQPDFAPMELKLPNGDREVGAGGVRVEEGVEGCAFLSLSGGVPTLQPVGLVGP